VYKVIISDLDGTLLNENHELSEYTRDIIKKINNKEILFFFATGRHFLDVFKLKKELGLTSSYSISSNGARIHGLNGELLISHNIMDEITNEILKTDMDIEIEGGACTDEKIYLINPKKMKIQSDTSDLLSEIYNKENMILKNVMKIFYFSENHDLLVKIDKEIKSKYIEYIDTVFSHEKFLEIIPKHISKGYAIKEIAKLEGFNLSDVLAFGDGFNDFEMLSITGKGIIMENASVDLKKVLPYNEIIGINNDDAVAKYLENLYLKDNS